MTLNKITKIYAVITLVAFGVWVAALLICACIFMARGHGKDDIPDPFVFSLMALITVWAILGIIHLIKNARNLISNAKDFINQKQ